MNSSEIIDRLQAALPIPPDMTNRAWLDAHEADVTALIANKGQTITEDLLGLKRSTIYAWKRHRQDAQHSSESAAAPGNHEGEQEVPGEATGPRLQIPQAAKAEPPWPPPLTPPFGPTKDFTIRESDLRWLNDQEFHQVWEAMGMVVRARFRR